MIFDVAFNEMRVAADSERYAQWKVSGNFVPFILEYKVIFCYLCRLLYRVG